ncbi:MAG TPA: hypothetical protein VF603_07100 [Allosphingosinicella sp.]|jgi:hypothetical protein
MADRTTDEIIAELTRRSRRFRPFLIIGLLIVLGSLIGSLIYLNILLGEARDAQRSAEGALEAMKDAARETDQSAQLTRAVELASDEAAGDRPPQIPLERIEVQILICTGSPAQNRQRAEALRIARPAGMTGRWRRDYLSPEGNARPNYRLARNEIRYNPGEEDAADRLLQMIRGLGSDAAKVLTFYPSPNSVSVFFCEGTNPPPLPAAAGAAEPPPANAN